jgi:dihydrofolate reductase
MSDRGGGVRSRGEAATSRGATNIPQGDTMTATYTFESGDPVEVVTRLKAESDVPLRSHCSLTLNRALLNAGLIDTIELTVFPVISGTTGAERIFDGADDFDLELLEARTFDRHTQVLTYRPARHS